MKLNSKSINYNVQTVDELVSLDGLEGDTVVVTDEDRGGVFVYREDNVGTNNEGTIFNGWTRQYEGAINVKWFGAKGDGVTDDTVAIQNAISATTNKYIYIPDGEYIISNIDLTKEVYIKGAGRGATLKTDGSGDMFTSSIDVKFFLEDVYLLDDLSILGTSPSYSAINTLGNVYMKNIYVIGFAYLLKNKNNNGGLMDNVVGCTNGSVVQLDGTFDTFRIVNCQFNINERNRALGESTSAGTWEGYATSYSLVVTDRVDGLIIDNCFTFGYGQIIYLTHLTQATAVEGGIQISNSSFDMANYFVIFDNTYSATSSFRTYGGFKASNVHFVGNNVVVVKSTTGQVTTGFFNFNNCTFGFLGGNVVRANLDTYSESVRILFSDCVFSNTSSTIDNGTSNVVNINNCYDSLTKITPILANTTYGVGTNQTKNVIQSSSEYINFTSGASSATQYFSFPNGSFTSTPNIVVTKVGGDNINGDANIVFWVYPISTTGFTIKAKFVNGGTAATTGVVYFNYVAIGQ